VVAGEGQPIGMVNLAPEEEGQFITLEPDYPRLARWFANAIAMKSFDDSKGRQFLAGYTDIIRYLTVTQPEEVKKLLGELQDG